MENKEAILGWTLGGGRGISSTIVQHRIHLVDNANPCCDQQQGLSPILQEVVRKEIFRWLGYEII